MLLEICYFNSLLFFVRESLQHQVQFLSLIIMPRYKIFFYYIYSRECPELQCLTNRKHVSADNSSQICQICYLFKFEIFIISRQNRKSLCKRKIYIQRKRKR